MDMLELFKKGSEMSEFFGEFLLLFGSIFDIAQIRDDFICCVHKLNDAGD